MKFFEEFTLNIINTSCIEWMAVISGIAYVILAARKNIWCWFFAFIGSALYVYLCYTSNLFLETYLQVFYVVMAVYGFLNWNKAEQHLKIIQWPIKYHLLNIVISGIFTFSLGYYFQHYTSQNSPYLDAFTTVFSLAATFMVTQKALHNWIYWIVIDVAGMFLYYQRGFALTTVLMGIYAIIAFFGWLEWRKSFINQEHV